HYPAVAGCGHCGVALVLPVLTSFVRLPRRFFTIPATLSTLMRYSVDFTDLKVERMKMKQIVMVLGLGGSALALFGTPLAQAHDNKAHVHGSAVLQVVMDGETVELALQSPLNNLLGFEHAPRT